MISVEYVTARKIDEHGAEEYTVDILLAYNVFEIDGYPDAEKMEVQVIPISKKVKLRDRVFITDLSKRASDYEVFDLMLNHEKKEASFFYWDIILPEVLRGCGIGRYAMSKLVAWGKRKCPDYRVTRLHLSSVDAGTDEARDLRNSFYERVGFDLHFPHDSSRRDGYCDAPSLSVLNVSYNEGKIVTNDSGVVLSRQQHEIVHEKEMNNNLVSRLKEYSAICSEFRKKYVYAMFGYVIVFVVAALYLIN